ncbi:hypothetical protein LMH87_001387 [Akanthomyces muscarius]|uniref:Cytochrome P450 n=1 Tax=Akanthomyces muscarius TaxID=2231603 RepID=A0A9W8UIL3_AKAMU|nr:hypothetical protein LMH87_001387 [Akanthomyces muscarius]KAJ4146828.1 hypothetical protein LMH87_001387 [Akanthomyces muscarius]
MDVTQGSSDSFAHGSNSRWQLYWPYLSALPVLLFASHVFWNCQKLSGFGGSPWAALSSIPHRLAMLNGKTHLFYAQANQKYGPIARVAPNILITSSPDVWAHANNTAGWRLDIQVTKYTSNNQMAIPIDMARKVQFFTLDVISKIGLGTAFGMLQADKDIDNYLQSSEEGLSIGNTALALGLSWLSHLPWLGQFIAPSPDDGSGFGKMMATCFRLVDERAAKSAAERSDMLASFIRHGLAGHELRTEALEQIIAGSDTTATAIRGTLLYVMTNPRSVIREAIRLSPPVANIFSRDVPPTGDTVSVDGRDVFIPGGTCIGYSAYAMHSSESIYGPDAGVFRPERWLETDKEKLHSMIFANELVFGYGKFRCLGQKVAQMELSKFVFETFRHFDMALIDPLHPWTSHNCLVL